ncbi:MAG: DUF58 domain-containing protein [Acidobacteriota bacterium]
MSRRTVPEGIRITKVGLWYIVLTVLVAIPAANTGNNSLYLVEACLLALLVVSGVTSRQNLRRLEIDLTPPAEVHAHRPFGLGYARYRSELELLVYPQLFDVPAASLRGAGPPGDRPSRTSGSGHELHTLRKFRPGDDRRAIHWKQTARTGDLIFMEREAEKGQRVSLLFDNLLPSLDDPGLNEAFERVVSEVATAAHFLNEKGCEIELITRGGVVGFGRGPRHRSRIMRTLALISPATSGRGAVLGSDPSAPSLSFSASSGASG